MNEEMIEMKLKEDEEFEEMLLFEAEQEADYGRES